MIRYMLDTNACISVVNDRPPEVRQRLLQSEPTEVAISQIVHYELAYGVCNSTQPQKNQANLEHFLRYVQVLDWGDEQAATAAHIRYHLQRIGQPIGPYDLLIAAHARSMDAVLVTHNTREFSRVEGLRIEDWEQVA
jgi:tRNA(fMet)-specific endonuclease VapC